MALILLAKPNGITPAYNPMVFAATSGESQRPGFRFIFMVYRTGNPEPIATLKVAKLPTSSAGYVDIAKLIQNQITNVLSPNVAAVSLPTTANYFNYAVKITVEYAYTWDFTDYQDSGTWVKLVSTVEPLYNAGDLISIKLLSVYNNTIDKLNGFHVVVSPPTLVAGVWELVIDIPFATVGSGPVVEGTTSYSDNRKLQDLLPPVPYPETPLDIVGLLAYNGAVPFVAFPTWSAALVLPAVWDNNLSSGGVQGKILTTAPNEITTVAGYTPGILELPAYTDQKFIIKPYQELKWNILPANSTLTQALIAYTNEGRIWMQPLPLGNMVQVAVDPAAPWISLSPNYGPGPQQAASFLNAGGTKFYDVFTVKQIGYEACDFITITYLDAGNIISTAMATVVGSSNGRRKYRFVDAVGRVTFLENLTMNAANPNGNWRMYTESVYNSVPVLVSNTSPSGVASGFLADGTTANNTVNAFRAFDNNPATSWVSSTNTGILQYEFNEPIAINGYKIDKGVGTTNALKSWILEFSADGVAWSIAQEITNDFSLDPYTFNISNPAAAFALAKYWRLKVTGVIFGTGARITSLELMEKNTVANLFSSNECPISSLARVWQNERSQPLGTTYTYLTQINSGIVVDPNPTLHPQRIYLDYSCAINTTQVKFLDRSGSYSTFDFPLRQVAKINVDKLSYKNEIGTVTNGQWTYPTDASETTVYNVAVNASYTLTTGWLNTGMNLYFEELMSSPEVYVKLVSVATTGRDSEQETPWLACTVTDTESINNRQKNKRLLSRTINLKLNSNNSINI